MKALLRREIKPFGLFLCWYGDDVVTVEDNHGREIQVSFCRGRGVRSAATAMKKLENEMLQDASAFC